MLTLHYLVIHTRIVGAYLGTRLYKSYTNMIYITDILSLTNHSVIYPKKGSIAYFSSMICTFLLSKVCSYISNIIKLFSRVSNNVGPYGQTTNYFPKQTASTLHIIHSTFQIKRALRIRDYCITCLSTLFT